MQKILENVLSRGIKENRAAFPPSASMQGSTQTHKQGLDIPKQFNLYLVNESANSTTV